MIKAFIKFIVSTLLLSILLSLAGWAFFAYTDIVTFHMGFVYVLAGYLAFSWAIQYGLYRFVEKRLAVFNRAFMLITGIKLLVLIAAMLLIAFTVPFMFKYLLVELLLLYLLFSVIEIREVLRFVKQK